MRIVLRLKRGRIVQVEIIPAQPDANSDGTMGLEMGSFDPSASIEGGLRQVLPPEQEHALGSVATFATRNGLFTKIPPNDLPRWIKTPNGEDNR